MIPIQLIAAFLSVLIISYDKPSIGDNASGCSELRMNNTLKYEDLIRGIDSNLLLQAVEQPDPEGALSRNKEGYFSVRFQMNMPKLTDLALVSERMDALDEFRKTIGYAFSHQNENGSFQLNPPEELVNDPAIQLPVKADSISAITFFSYALGISLNALSESQWYAKSHSISASRNEISSHNPNIEKTLLYLMDNKQILKQADFKAPNRLLFNAIAFYSLGTHSGHAEAQSSAIEFLDMALNLIDGKEGYFIEAGGWDSSYNGVAIKLGLELYSMLPVSHPFKEPLEKALICAVKWQESRILSSGEISTEGNTRVYPGGESFLSEEKKVDVEKTVRAFYYFSVLTGKQEYHELADRIVGYYR